jgi:mannose-6-phosphate isomerase-like protein (cupin superfamily)
MPQIVNDDDGAILAIIIRSSHKKNGIEFFTPHNFSQQLAYMNHAKGETIQPHIHCEVIREIVRTQEVLIVKSGKVQVDLYTKEKKLRDSLTLETGDIILLASGGHGFTMLEPTEMIEIKQGPYLEDGDKVRFSPSK